MSTNNYLKVTRRTVADGRTVVEREEFVFFDDRNGADIDRAVDESIRLHLLLGGRRTLAHVSIWRGLASPSFAHIQAIS